jgi:hypothetical protein
MSEQVVIADHFSFILVRTIRPYVHIIKLPNPSRNTATLKKIISPLSKTKSKSESFTILFYGNPLNSACGYIQMTVTVVAIKLGK